MALTVRTHIGEIDATNANGIPITTKTYGSKEIILLLSHCIARIFTLILIPHINDGKRRINE